MEKRKSSVRYAPEVRERAVRMVREHTGEHASQWEAIGSIAAKIGCTAETLRKWIRQAEIDEGQAPGVTSEAAREIRFDHCTVGEGRHDPLACERRASGVKRPSCSPIPPGSTGRARR